MILDENLFQDYRKPLKEFKSSEENYCVYSSSDSGCYKEFTGSEDECKDWIKNNRRRFPSFVHLSIQAESEPARWMRDFDVSVYHNESKSIKEEHDILSANELADKVFTALNNCNISGYDSYIDRANDSVQLYPKDKDISEEITDCLQSDFVFEINRYGHIIVTDLKSLSESKSIKEGYNGVLTDEDEELLELIADRYVTSYPVSGRWETETQHELEAIADELDVSEEDAKKIMIDYLGFSEEQFNESESINESAEEDKPYSSKEVEQELKSITNNWRENDGVCKCWYKEEKQHAVKILKQHYKIVETSQDGDWTVIAFETPIQKESMLEDYLRESNYEERAARLSDRDLDTMIELIGDMASDFDDAKYGEYLNALNAEKSKRAKEHEYKSSRRFKRDSLGVDGKYPYYITLYNEYPIYEHAEGGYYYAGLEAQAAEGYNSFKEAAQAISEAAEELNSENDYNFVKKSTGEYRDYGDKYIGTGAILCIENNKQLGSRERGYQPYE